MTHSDSLWVNTLERHADSLQRSIDSLQTKFDVLQAKNDLFCSVVESANDGVSNQLSATNNFLALIAVILTIAAIGLGLLIDNRKRQIEIMAKTVDEKKETVEKLAKIVDEKADKVDTISKTTEELDKQIHNNLSALYKDLREEETKTLFQRLVKEPLDINNIGQLLLAREVDTDNFQLLKEAFVKLPEQPEIGDDSDIDSVILSMNSDTKHSFMLQFFQHFFYQSVKDDDVRPAFVENFKNVFDNAFESDIIRATEGLCKALADEDSKFDKEYVLTEFLKAINTSKFENFALLRKMLEDNLNKQGLLKSVIEKCKSTNFTLTLFKDKML